MEQQHGGNIWRYSEGVLDFSASLNPLGMPDCVRDAAINGVSLSTHYPDPDCAALREAIAARLGLSMSAVFCGNGGAELLDRVVHAVRPRRSLLCVPTFGEYERVLSACGSDLVFCTCDAALKFDLKSGFLEQIVGDLDLVILCSPNNPTGRLIDPVLLEQICDRCRQLGIWLLVDESFLSLSDHEDSQQLQSRLATDPRLILLRSLTKSYAIPGLRLGYLLSGNQKLLAELGRHGQPWSVSVPAQMAGVAAMSCPEWPALAIPMVLEQRKWLEQELHSLGFITFESTVNYLMLDVHEEVDLQALLLEHHILIRDCSSFRGLRQGYYRIAVRTEAENRQLILALHQLRGQGRI